MSNDFKENDFILQSAVPPDAELPKHTPVLEKEQCMELPQNLDSPLWQIPENLLSSIDNSACLCLMPIAQRLFFWSFIYGVCPKRYLEIGTAEGGSAFIVDSATKALGFDDFQGVCVDLKFGIIPELYAQLNTHFTFFEEKSSLEVMKKAVTQVKGLFDVVLVDGDHTYDHALFDTMLVIPFVKPGGYILVDDAGYYQVRDAIQYTIERFNLIDAGFMCRHLTPYGNIHRVEETGPWKGEEPFVSGLYVLRKPL